MNPYANHLGDQNPRHVIAQTPSRLAAMTKRLGSEGLSRSLAPGKWTAAFILCHLADTELAFAFRIRQALAETHHVIQPFDQDSWARTYDSQDPNLAIQVFSAVRAWNVALLEKLPAEAFLKPVTHPERGPHTLQTIVETMGGHDLNHLSQLESIAAKAS